MNPTSNNLEIEIKLQLASFTDYLKLIGYLGNIEIEERLVNCFFDSEVRHLAKKGWVLRVRAGNDTGLITAKDIGKQSGSAMVRQEIEAEISKSAAMDIINLRTDILTIPITPIDFIKKEFPGIKLAKLVRFDNVRQKKAMPIGGNEYILEIDKTEFADGSCDYELEVELTDLMYVPEVENNLQKIFKSLNIPYEKQEESKFSRAMKRAGLS